MEINETKGVIMAALRLYQGRTNPSDEFPEGKKFQIETFGQTFPMLCVTVGNKKLHFDMEESEILRNAISDFLERIGE